MPAAPPGPHAADPFLETESAVRISVVIPTLNEAPRLEQAVARLRLDSAPEDLEIIVADGGSTDATQAAARRLVDLLVISQRPGRAVQMHQGALSASGDILLFLHADTQLPKNWRRTLNDAWNATPPPGATAFRLAFDRDEPVYRLIAALGGLRSRWTGVPQGDQALACRREDYLRVGGFPPVALMEEYYLLPKLATLGPILTLPDAASTSARRYERNGAIFNALRNTAIIALFRLGVPPDKLERLYS